MYLLNGSCLSSFRLRRVSQAIFKVGCAPPDLNKLRGRDKVMLESRVMGDYLVRFGEH
jgi:hypothetical protein